MKFGLSDNIIELIQKVFEANPKVDEVIIFGSRAKGNYKEGSDIDLAVKGRNISFDDMQKLVRELDELKLPYKIDLLDYANTKDKDIIEHIDRVGIVFYQRWKETKLSHFLSFGNGKVRPKSEGIIPVYGGNGILGYTNEANYTNETIIIGRVGAYCGSVYYEKGPIWVSDNALAAKPKNNFSAKFLFYFLKDLELNKFAEGSSHPLVTQSLLNSIDITLTDDFKEQSSIAAIFSSLDDKIDLLHRQNKNLEQLAETLFRQWFVEEGEESWETGTISDVADHLKESVNPSRLPDTFFNHYSLPAFDENRTPIKEIGKDILSNKYKIVPNSILVSKLNPRFPRVWPLYGAVDDNSICSTEFQIAKPKRNSWFGFIYCFLTSKEVMQELTNASGGTSGSHQRVNPDDIFNLSFLLPPDELVEKFDLITKYYWIKIKSNYTQIKTLSQLRDTLLPKLMSGEVRVDMN